ncbi:hypothetical protein [uncultured Lentibacter sp.]|jgi:uncharacterized protein YidB (DUF937 family)|uniref:hypothetical protein n=1 Tax=uncultured Lentibacter sp. TaxID=1659309 RepID=UPI00260F52DC|nr:hypothetical protein [uncultured Lentibacter sp.]
MKQVTMLAMSEAVELDVDKLDALYEALGDVAAEDVVCRAMEELAVKLAQVDRLYRSHQIEEMYKAVRSMGAIADQIGMVLLAQVSRDVVACVDAADSTALAAVVQRLMRSGEGSLTQIWRAQDLSI